MTKQQFDYATAEQDRPRVVSHCATCDQDYLPHAAICGKADPVKGLVGALEKIRASLALDYLSQWEREDMRTVVHRSLANYQAATEGK